MIRFKLYIVIYDTKFEQLITLFSIDKGFSWVKPKDYKVLLQN